MLKMFFIKTIRLFLKIYRIIQRPPETNSQETLTEWLCWIHNQINKKIGKPIFDCQRVNERWRDGWKDGSCD